MKKQITNSLIAIFTVIMLFASCAENQTLSNVSLNKSMDTWMKQNHPDVQFIDSGYYYTIHTDDSKVDDDLFPVDSSVVEIMITGKTIDGDYFLNSYKEFAIKLLGGVDARTRYVPFRYKVENYLYPFTNIGISDLLKRMNVGDSADVFLSPANSYGTIENGLKQYLGFNGTHEYTNGNIAHFTVKLKNFNNNPLDVALKKTENYAEKVLNLNVRDSIKKGLYVSRIDSLGGGEFIGKKDTTIDISYTGYFMDGFVFDTTVEEVARQHRIYNPEAKYGPYSYVVGGGVSGDEFSGFSHSFRYALEVMKPGDKAIFVTIPEWAYGEAGSYRYNATLMPVYTPLVFNIEIINEV